MGDYLMNSEKIGKIYPEIYASLEQFRREVFFNNIKIKD